MCQMDNPDCRCERHALAVYRDHRTEGKRHGTAYLAALQAFRKLHPEASAFHAMAALKEALSREPESGVIDSGAGPAR